MQTEHNFKKGDILQGIWSGDKYTVISVGSDGKLLQVKDNRTGTLYSITMPDLYTKVGEEELPPKAHEIQDAIEILKSREAKLRYELENIVTARQALEKNQLLYKAQ